MDTNKVIEVMALVESFAYHIAHAQYREATACKIAIRDKLRNFEESGTLKESDV